MFLPVGVENIPQNPLEAAQAQAVPRTVPLAWQSIGHGLLQLLPALARHSQPLPAPVGPTCPCHPLCCDILTPQGPEAPWPLPSPAFSLPAPAHPSQERGAHRESLSAASSLPEAQSCTCLESN